MKKVVTLAQSARKLAFLFRDLIVFPLGEICFLLFVIVSQNSFSALCHRKKTISFALP